jgi:hypothetical protein
VLERAAGEGIDAAQEGPPHAAVDAVIHADVGRIEHVLPSSACHRPPPSFGQTGRQEPHRSGPAPRCEHSVHMNTRSVHKSQAVFCGFLERFRGRPVPLKASRCTTTGDQENVTALTAPAFAKGLHGWPLVHPL